MVGRQLQFCSAHQSNPLFWAASQGDQEYHLLSYITTHSSIKGHLLPVVNSEDWMGMTPLTTAARHGCETAVALLLETGKAVINLETSTGRVALSEAARYGHINVVKTLLEFGAIVEMKLTRGHSALWWSKRIGNTLLENLLEREMKASVTKRLLMIAVSKGDRKAVVSAVNGGEPYRINHVAVLEHELQDAKYFISKWDERFQNLQIEVDEINQQVLGSSSNVSLCSQCHITDRQTFPMKDSIFTLNVYRCF